MKKTKEPLSSLNPRDFKEIILNSAAIVLWFEIFDAIWIHNGDNSSPHAELTTGLCSNGYFNCPEILKYGNLNEIFAFQLYLKLLESGINENEIDWVIGSPYSAITFSYEVSKLFGAIHGFTEKDPNDPKGKRMLWRRMNIPKGSKVLQIEELISTSHTFKEVRRAVEDGNAEPVDFLPEVGVLIHRPAKLPIDYGDRKIVALVEREIWAIDPKDCHLCKNGSPRYKPKSHWKELTS